MQVRSRDMQPPYHSDCRPNLDLGPNKYSYWLFTVSSLRVKLQILTIMSENRNIETGFDASTSLLNRRLLTRAIMTIQYIYSVYALQLAYITHSK